jgi:hypothetical protein
MALVFLCVGYALCFLGGLWIVLLAWQKGALWGIGCLVFPILQLFYVALNWKEAKSPFLIQVAGGVAFLISSVVGK